MTPNLTPLEVCERLFGHIERIGPMIGLDRKTAYHWRHARKDREGGDFPSPGVMRALLAHSDQHNLGLTADHLIRGAPASEIEAILAARGTRMEAAE